MPLTQSGYGQGGGTPGGISRGVQHGDSQCVPADARPVLLSAGGSRVGTVNAYSGTVAAQPVGGMAWLDQGTPPAPASNGANWVGGDLVNFGTDGRLIDSGLTTADIASLALFNTEITSPQAFLDYSLATTYNSFLIIINRMRFSAPAALALAISTNGGTSFLCDAINTDTYDSSFVENDVTVNGTFVDSVINWTTTVDANTEFNLFGSFMPGDTGRNISLKTMFSWWHTTQHNGTQESQLNLAATIAPTLLRATDIRIAPYSADFNPPSSGINMTSGNIQIIGLR